MSPGTGQLERDLSLNMPAAQKYLDPAQRESKLGIIAHELIKLAQMYNYFQMGKTILQE